MITNWDIYLRYLRMSTEMFEDLVIKVTPLIQRRDTHLRKCISPSERLSVTLRHLATVPTMWVFLFSRHCNESYTCLCVGPNPNHGYTNFDNFLWSMLTTFQLITLDYWEDVYNKVVV
ncbi:Sodium channel protein 60E [Cyphomyrmex costatus]|uniref:Sodium channel protein 60E n=1 Tax=Cyphomyrmex costatus TaxID=456900 RepID=A0A151IQV6_9HYME|nr:Sodium channel protein 60E [Cyphomyrmex costatus]